MGADIHLWVEVREADGWGAWIPADSIAAQLDAYEAVDGTEIHYPYGYPQEDVGGRDYRLFAFLAGVRDREWKPVDVLGTLRGAGWPADASVLSEGDWLHSHRWCTLMDWLGLPWESVQWSTKAAPATDLFFRNRLPPLLPEAWSPEAHQAAWEAFERPTSPTHLVWCDELQAAGKMPPDHVRILIAFDN